MVKSIAAVIGFGLYLWWANDLPDASIIRGANARWFVPAGVMNTSFLLGYYVALAIAP